MSQISRISARQILDSKGNPTIEVDVITNTGILGRASVPSDSSGKYKAVELRDNDMGRFMGKSVSRAVSNVNKILNEELNGVFVEEQSLIDSIMIDLDGTKNKSNIGANAILGVSLACAKAAALTSGQPLYRYIGGVNANTLPVPVMNILNGGSKADNHIDIQEFMIMPVGARYFSESLRMGIEIFHNLKSILKKKGYSVNVNNEGGLAPNLKSNEEAVEFILQAIEKSNFKAGKDVLIALDAAASEFYNPETKLYRFESAEKDFTSDELINYWKNLTQKYPISSIEDGLDQDDRDGWLALTNEIGDKIQITGDDLFVTNPDRLIEGISKGAANSVLIKPIQAGTLTETINTVNLAKKYGYTTIVSYCSGETEDTFIAELAVALNTGFIKTGSISGIGRVAKYNQLLRIEEMLGNQAVFGTFY